MTRRTLKTGYHLMISIRDNRALGLYMDGHAACTYLTDQSIETEYKVGPLPSIMPEFRIADGKHRQYLCFCETLCAFHNTWSIQQQKDVKGSWISPALYRRHQKMASKIRDLDAQADLGHTSGSAVLMRTLSSSGGAMLSLSPDQTEQMINIPPDDEVVEEDPETLVQTTSVEDTLADLEHLSISINRCILSFSVHPPLTFIHPPNPHSGPYISMDDIPVAPNHVVHPLSVQDISNNSILTHENRMYNYLQPLRNAPHYDSPGLEMRHEQVLSRVEDEIRRIDGIRAREWDRQLQTVQDRNRHLNASSSWTEPVPTYVDCGELMISWY
jgi:hypothetical protein